MKKVSAREKKTLYAGIAIVVVIAIYWAVTSFSPGDGESIAVKVTEKENLLRRQKELIEHKDLYEKRIEDAEKDIEKIQARLIPVNNASAASTELQRILNDFAARSGVVIQTVNNLPERKVADSDSIVKVAVSIGVNYTLEDLVDFLVAIKNYDKFLKVEELSINAPPDPRQVVVRRTLTMVIAGYINVPPPPVEPAAKPGENAAHTASASYAGRASGKRQNN